MESFVLFNDTPVDVLMKARDAWPGMADQEWWAKCCGALAIYEPPAPSLKLAHAERKWELVSALQKTVRRGDTELALKLVSAMCSLPEELPYFWKRFCTIAAEDIGPGCIEAMNFVICASQTYTPKKTADFQYPVLCFLAELLCAVPKSRVYCRMATIDSMVKNHIKPHDLTSHEHAIVTGIMAMNGLSKDNWAVKYDARAEYMLKYQLYSGVEMDEILINSNWTRPQPVLLKGLPDYSYDTHTRVGKNVVRILTGFKIIKDFFHMHPVMDGHQLTAISEAIFNEEGELCEDDRESLNLQVLEVKFIAASLNWSVTTWLEFRVIIKRLLDDGAINSLRIKVLDQQGY